MSCRFFSSTVSGHTIAVPDLTWQRPAVAQWSRQVPLLAGGQSR